MSDRRSAQRHPVLEDATEDAREVLKSFQSALVGDPRKRERELLRENSRLAEAKQAAEQRGCVVVCPTCATQHETQWTPRLAPDSDHAWTCPACQQRCLIRVTLWRLDDDD